MLDQRLARVWLVHAAFQLATNFMSNLHWLKLCQPANTTNLLSQATARLPNPRCSRISKNCHPCGIRYASRPKAVIVHHHHHDDDDENFTPSLIETILPAWNLLRVLRRPDCFFWVGTVLVWRIAVTNGRHRCCNSVSPVDGASTFLFPRALLSELVSQSVLD